MRSFIIIFIIFNSLNATILEEQLEKFLSLNDKENVVNTYVDIVRQNRVQNPKKAIQYAFEGIQYINNDTAFVNELGHLYAGLGNTLESQGLVEQSLEYHTTAIEIYSRINSKSNIAWRQLDIGTVYFNQQMLEAASQRYGLALELFTSINDLNGMAVTENNLGLINQKQDQPLKALLHFETALKYRYGIGEDHLIGHSFSYLGAANAQLGRYDKAFKLFKKANHFLLKSDNQEIIINNYVSMAELYRKLGEIELAIEYFQKALLLAKTNNIIIKIPKIELDLGNLYVRLKEYTNALKHFENGISIAKENKSLTDKSNLYRALNEFYTRKGNYKKSLVMLHHYTTIQDTIKSLGNVETLAKIEVSRVIKENEDIVEAKHREIKEQKLYRNMMGLGFVFSLIILMGLINRYYYIKKTSNEIQMQQHIIHQREITIQKEKEKRLENDLHHKHKLLTQKALNMAQTKDILTNISKKLKDGNNVSSISVRKSLGLIQDQLNQENEWSEFEKWFGEVHNDFYENLKLKYPTLSQREQKICALLKLKLSTKDISRLTNLSPGSIEQYRIRIRKKLNLERGANLTTFIDSI